MNFRPISVINELKIEFQKKFKASAQKNNQFDLRRASSEETCCQTGK